MPTIFVPQSAEDQVGRIADLHLDEVILFAGNLDANIGKCVGVAKIRVAADSHLIRRVAVLKMLESTEIGTQLLDEEPKLPRVGPAKRLIDKHGGS